MTCWIRATPQHEGLATWTRLHVLRRCLSVFPLYTLQTSGMLNEQYLVPSTRTTPLLHILIALLSMRSHSVLVL